jgi:hypothetical protein
MRSSARIGSFPLTLFNLAVDSKLRGCDLVRAGGRRRPR